MGSQDAFQVINAASRRRRSNPIALLTGLVDYWTAGVGLADTGGLVDSWTGSLKGRVLSGSGGSRPTRDTVDSLDSPDWLAAGSEQHLDMTGWAPAAFDHWTTMVVKVPTTSSWGLSSARKAAVAQNWNYADTGGSFFYSNIGTGTVRLSGIAIPGGAGFYGARRVVTFVNAQTYASIWVNGVKTAEASYASAGVLVPDEIVLGWLAGIAGAAYDFRGPVHDFVLVEGIPTEPSIVAVHAHLTKLRGIS